MSERTMDGLAAGRVRGRASGQKPKPGMRQARLAREMYEAWELTVARRRVRRHPPHHLDRLDRLDSPP